MVMSLKHKLALICARPVTISSVVLVMLFVMRGGGLYGSWLANVGRVALQQAWRAENSGNHSERLAEIAKLCLAGSLHLNDDPSFRLSYGQALATSGEVSAAEKVWNEVDVDATYFFALGESARLRSDLLLAERWFSFGSLLDPDHGDWYLFRARQLAAENNHDAARVVLDEALDDERSWSEGSRVEAQYLLGENWLAQGELDRARAAYEDLLVSAPDHYGGLVRLGNIALDRDGDDGLAVSYWQQAVSLQPDISWAHQQLAKFYLQNDQKDAAIIQLRRLLEIDTTNEWASDHLARLTSPDSDGSKP